MLEHLHPEQAPAPSRPLLAARRWLPHALSLGRMLLGPLFALSLDDAPIAPLSIALLACASDFVDGRLARALGTGSPRGAALDVLASLYAARTEVGVKFDEIKDREGLGAALRWRAAQFAE